MKTALLCHHDDDLNRLALPRWLGSFSDVAGIVVIEETGTHTFRRAKRELKRVGTLRFLDVLAYRLYHRVFLQRRDSAYERRVLNKLSERYPPVCADVPILTTASPNSPEAHSFLDGLKPDLTIARCKVILKPEILRIPRVGTFVMHPGICPEYRNAHGCFWALAEGDLRNVGMTLLKIDDGIDTGPVYGFFTSEFDEQAESHIVIQHRMLFDNLDVIRHKLLEIETGKALPIDVAGRRSRVWGQPWLTQYLQWKQAAKSRAKGYETRIAPLS